jgi:hypothetical protein
MTATTEDFFTNTGSGDFLSASAAFKNVGDIVRGVICEEPVLIDQTVFNKPNELKRDKNGNVLKQLVVVLQTEHRDWEAALKPAKDADGNPRPASDDIGKRSLFVKFKLRDAIAEALKAAGAKQLEVGGELAVAFTGESEFNGFDVKEYKAQYKAPTSNASTDFFGDNTAAKSDTAPPF